MRCTSVVFVVKLFRSNNHRPAKGTIYRIFTRRIVDEELVIRSDIDVNIRHVNVMCLYPLLT